MQDPEYRDIQRAAKATHLSIAAWVRQAYPAADVDSMLTEIESGYGVADGKTYRSNSLRN